MHGHIYTLNLFNMKSKKLFITAIIIFLTIHTFAQKDKYPSKEEDNYNKKSGYKYVPYKSLDTTFILCFKSDYYEIIETEMNYEPYSFNKCSTPHSKYLKDYVDSIRLKLSRSGFFKQAQQELEREIGKIGDIDKRMILKYDKRDSIEAFIYESCKYENIFFGEPGIWIGYSENNGDDWSYYYTGIVQRQPIFVKHYSQRPLIKEKGKLEIDACFLRQLSEFSHPAPAPDYECVKDGVYLTLDIEIIARDSDGDGLTDIIEDKFHTDKYNKDTNGNGIPDNIDPNPRMNYPRTEKSKIYEALLDRNWETLDEKLKGHKLIFNEEPAIYVTDSTETILIVTDDKDLMGISPQNYRVIFMTTEEYMNRNGFKKQLNEMQISPLFKVDNMKDTYKMKERFNTGGSAFLIRKTKKGWIMEIISIWIS